nr:MAG TPA: bacterial toxin [Caudoviricetes sp.]
MKYKIVKKKKFQKSLDILKKRGLSEKAKEDLATVIDLLAQGKSLPEKYCDHPLKGHKKNRHLRDCHIQGDLILIYEIKKDLLILELLDIGSHSYVFGESLEENFEFNLQLNPSLFDGDKLKVDVRNALLKIADTFVDDLKSNDIPLNVVDYWLLGSNAAYNYNEKSDIDIHIIVNNEGIECDKNILNLLYNYAKSSFNNNHDIKVKGHEVELYIEGIDSTAASNGIYSLKFDLWVKKPYPPDLEFSFDPNSSEIYIELKNSLDSLETKEDLKDFIDGLYLIRKSSLAKDGELGEGNLIFKQLRNEGVLDELKTRLNKLEDQELTLENLNKSNAVRIDEKLNNIIKGEANGL